MLLIVGLGNPGQKYVQTRHNVGYHCLDALQKAYMGYGVSFSPWRKRFQGQTSDVFACGKKIVLLKPETFYNNSGTSVGEAVRFFKSMPEDVLVIHDDLDLDPGQFRFKKGGGTAGNRGLRSLIEHIGADFHRLRIGIGHAPYEEEGATSWVLGNFSKKENLWLSLFFDQISKYYPLVFRTEFPKLANRIHLFFQQEHKFHGI